MLRSKVKGMLIQSIAPGFYSDIMRHLLRLCRKFVALPLLIPLFVESADAKQASNCTAFARVTVVRTDIERLLPNRTVIVRNGRIAEVALADRVNPPADCSIIDAPHHYLIPGLVDSHVHLPLAGAADQKLVLQLLLANGITTAINMKGSPDILALRHEISKGEIIGPTIYTTGRFVQQPAFMTAEQVRAEVVAEKRAGYDFIKVHGNLTKEAYDTLFQTAREQNIRVVGHVPRNLGVDAALGRQILIVHAEEYLYSYFQFERSLPTDPEELERMIREVSMKTARSGTWVSPTLWVFRQIISQAADIDAVLQRPEMRYLPRHLTTGTALGGTDSGWYPPENHYVKRWPPEQIPTLRAQYSVMQQLVRGLRDAGVPLLVGTDPLVPCVIPGFSFKNELEQLNNAGLSPFEVLQAATFNAARFLGTAEDSGTIAPGKVADLVLLNANPLSDVDNINRQDGVMLRGRWFPEDELQAGILALESASNVATTR